MGLKFKDIGAWTPSTISIVDEPYHPLAYFEVYENDEEFVKKFREIEVNSMSQNQNGEKTVTVSEGFIEGLINKAVAKMKPEPQVEPTPQPTPGQSGEEEVTNAKILEEIQKQNERIEALEKNQNQNQGQSGDNPSQKTDPEQNEENNEQNTPSQNDTDPTPKTVELPLNPDGTLNLEDGAVAKYLPRGNSSSQSVDVDLQRGNKPDKSFNERSGRDSNGMSW